MLFRLQWAFFILNNLTILSPSAALGIPLYKNGVITVSPTELSIFFLITQLNSDTVFKPLEPFIQLLYYRFMFVTVCIITRLLFTITRTF